MSGLAGTLVYVLDGTWRSDDNRRVDVEPKVKRVTLQAGVFLWGRCTRGKNLRLTVDECDRDVTPTTPDTVQQVAIASATAFICSRVTSVAEGTLRWGTVGCIRRCR